MIVPSRKATKQYLGEIVSTAFLGIWVRSRCTPTLRSRLAFVLISKLYRQMYANTGIATDSARGSWANRWARLIAAVSAPVRRAAAADVGERIATGVIAGAGPDSSKNQ